MQRLDLGCQKQPHFIGSWMMSDPQLCENLIGFFEQHPELQAAGRVAGGLLPNKKQSTDMTITPKDLANPTHAIFAGYMQDLMECLRDYLAQWPFLASLISVVDVGPFNIQRYTAGEHFLAVHSERSALGTSHRLFAWMTYLNDVNDGGTTNFHHYDLDVQPKRGLTMIWPAEWTHAHRAMPVNSGVKYIITGWMHFPPAAPDPITMSSKQPGAGQER